MSLTLEQAYSLINKELLVKDKTYLVIDGLSRNDTDDFVITDIFNTNNTLKLSVQNLIDGKISFIDYRKIKKIDGMNINKFLVAEDIGSSVPETIDIETDVVNDVIDRENAMIDGFTLKDGMKFIFEKDKTPKYCNRVLTVKFEKGLIKLVANRGRPKKMR